MSSSLVAIRAQSEAGMAEQKRLAEKKKNLVVLIHDFLIENGYLESATKLGNEASAILTKFSSADNVDLMLILSEFEAFYEMKFDKKPKLTRKLEEDAKQMKVKAPAGKASDASSKRPSNKDNQVATSSEKLPSLMGNNNNGPEEDSSSFGVQGVSVNNANKSKNDEGDASEKILKPPPQFGGDAEMKQLASSISREIYQESPNVRFEDIIQLDEAKRLLREAVHLPLRYPTIFTGILRPWRGILLHGPPGTGKTMLAKAVATECHTTFFNISASTLVSKWRGDSEKLVRVLFEVARYHAPSTIFLDEIDSILSSRNGDGQEHEASRRMKTELLIQMDGVKGSSSGSGRSEQIFVMAASNLPWDLDVAVLRRLEKRVLVPLPVEQARESMIRKHISNRVEPNFNFSEVSAATNGFSGADIELLCREAAMMPVRRLMDKIQNMEYAPPVPPSKGATGIRQQVKQSLNNNTLDVDEFVRSDPITMDDMRVALSRTRPSSDGSMSAYEAWQRDYGSI